MQQQGAGTAGPDLGQAQGLIARFETESRPSLASQLPQGLKVFTRFVINANHCGSWFASDEARANTKNFEVRNDPTSLAAQRAALRFDRLGPADRKRPVQPTPPGLLQRTAGDRHRWPEPTPDPGTGGKPCAPGQNPLGPTLASKQRRSDTQGLHRQRTAHSARGHDTHRATGRRAAGKLHRPWLADDALPRRHRPGVRFASRRGHAAIARKIP